MYQKPLAVAHWQLNSYQKSLAAAHVIIDLIQIYPNY